MTDTPSHPTYTLRATDPHAHLFEVTLALPAPAADGQRLQLPAWIPGSYMVRDFARHVVRLECEVLSSGKRRELAVHKVDKSTWQCAPIPTTDEEVTLVARYWVYAYDLSVRGAWLDQTRAYVNGVCVFLAAEGREHESLRVRLERPQGVHDRGHRVATSLRSVDVDSGGYGEYEAQDYADLIDHPVEMSDIEREVFEVQGVPHGLVLSGRQRCDIDRLVQDLSAICHQHHAMLGWPEELDRYEFLLHAADVMGGGLEHRFSNSCIVARDMLPRRGMSSDDTRYVRLLALLSHEYFHLWNVKRTQPAAFQPFDLRAEQYTRTLWVFEGITSYYDKLALLRAGVISTARYLKLLGEVITGVMRTPGREQMSVADSSFDAWIKLYKRDENAHNSLISYYSKGSLIALALDLHLRIESAGECSLDRVMQALWERHGATGEGIAEDGFEALAEEVSGVSLAGFFAATVHGTEDPPLEALLAKVGVRLAWRIAEQDGAPRAWHAGQLGAGCRIAGGGVVLDYVTRGGAAHAAGLSAGDRLLALDGTRLDAHNVRTRLRDSAPGATASLHAFRRDELMQFHVTFAEPPVDTAHLSLIEDASPAADALREQWWRGIGPLGG
ncbi:MAG: PDZ domain-containing protein [Pseudomonadota bacterium]